MNRLMAIRQIRLPRAILPQPVARGQMPHVWLPKEPGIVLVLIHLLYDTLCVQGINRHEKSCKPVGKSE